MGKLSTYIQTLNQFFTKVGQDIKSLRDNKLPYIGANQPIDFNMQSLSLGGKLIKKNTVFEENSLSDSTLSSMHYRMLSNVISLSLNNFPPNGDIVLKLPIKTLTKWVAKIDFSNITLESFTLYIEARGTAFRHAAIYGNTDIVNRVVFYRKTNDSVYVLIERKSGIGWNYWKANLSELYYNFDYDASLYEKNGYSFFIDEIVNIPDLAYDGQILSDDFKGIPYLLDYNNFTNTPDLSGYITTETDPTVPSHVKAITTNDINAWDEAYSWGNHALVGYLVSSDIIGYATESWVTSQGYSTQTLTAGAGINIVSDEIVNTAPNATHTGDVTGATALTIATHAVTNNKLGQMNANTLKGRETGNGSPQDLTATQVRSIINVEDGATATKIGVDGDTATSGDFNFIGEGILRVNKVGNDIIHNVELNTNIQDVSISNQNIVFDPTDLKTVVRLSGGPNNITFEDHTVKGAELFVTTKGLSVSEISIIINILDIDGSALATSTLIKANTSTHLIWSEADDAWIQVSRNEIN